MVLVFFIYGLAFFCMGFAIALESGQSSGLRLAGALPFLAAFGILHGLTEWSDTLLLVQAAVPATISMDSLRLARTILMGVSTLALVQFGSSLLRGAEAPEKRGRVATSVLRWTLGYAPALLGLAWLAVLVLLSAIGYPVGSRQWLTHADIWARFLLYLPGSVLAGTGLISEARRLEEADFANIARDARFAAATFFLNALVAGLVVPPGQQLPDLALDYDRFQSLFGVPVQLLRALSAVAIAFFMLRVLRVFRFKTQRQVEEAERRRLLAALEERERIAREMHDGIAQVVGFLNLRIRVARQMLSSGRLADAEAELDQIQRIVREAYSDIRQSIGSLRTATGLEQGLEAAIRESAADFSDQNGIPVELALDEGKGISFPQEAEVQLVRIVQEALTNVRKHARATKVWIRLERHDGAALLAVEDDGIGFDPSGSDARRRRCFGLETMRERAESIGARMEVISVPGEGTRVQVRLPLGQRATGSRASHEDTAGR